MTKLKLSKQGFYYLCVHGKQRNKPQCCRLEFEFCLWLPSASRYQQTCSSAGPQGPLQCASFLFLSWTTETSLLLQAGLLKPVTDSQPGKLAFGRLSLGQIERCPHVNNHNSSPDQRCPCWMVMKTTFLAAIFDSKFWPRVLKTNLERRHQDKSFALAQNSLANHHFRKQPLSQVLWANLGSYPDKFCCERDVYFFADHMPTTITGAPKLTSICSPWNFSAKITE